MAKRTKKRKLNLLPLLVIILIIGAIVYYFFKDPINNIFRSNDFSAEAAKVINDNDLSEIVSKQKYSKTLDIALASKEYKESYFKYYSSIDYHDEKDFIIAINSLLDKEYTVDEINNIYTKLTKNAIDKLLRKDYMNLSEYFGIPNFDPDNYERYLSYAGKKDASMADIVTYVNIGLDHNFYSKYDEVKDPSSYLVLVNKYHQLPSNYEPTDLISLSFDEKYKLRSVVADSFEKMINDAKTAGHTINPYSAYRSFTRQTELYTYYSTVDGTTIADTYSARPGFSEHQTGLAVDVKSPGSENKLNDAAFKWISENCYKYGFIIRYPDGKIDITGYMYEDWHLRYIGIQDATKINSLNITYDEYYDLYVKQQ